MVDDPHQILGIPSSIKRLRKVCKSFIRKWKQSKKSFCKDGQAEVGANYRETVKSKYKGEIIQKPGDDQPQERTSEAVHIFRCRSFHGDYGHNQGSLSSSPKSSKRCLSLRSNGPPPIRSNDSKPSPATSVNGLTISPSLLGNCASKRNTTCPIMFSNSPGMVKASPIEKQLECTLEELCYGCQKKIKITRDIIQITGKILQEEEELSVNVEPGWKKGTKITFEEKGNEMPGLQPGDITIVIAEKRHPLFRREGYHDLELVLKIDLVKALTGGCNIFIPLLDGENMSLTVDDIIHPGYETIFEGQGMSIFKENGKRGNLKLSFLVEFPSELTDKQRSDIVSILENSS